LVIVPEVDQQYSPAPFCTKGSDTETGLLQGVGVEVTVIADVATNSPSTVVAVIVAVPTDIPVTTPLVLTVATAELLVLQIIFLLLALLGEIVAVKDVVVPMPVLAFTGLRVIPVTGTLTMITVIAEVAVKPPSTVVAFIVALPALTPETTPLALTVAMAVLPETQVTPLFVALLGATVAVRVVVEPAATVIVTGEIVIPVTGTDATSESI
jgi:hypothetical protein